MHATRLEIEGKLRRPRPVDEGRMRRFELAEGTSNKFWQAVVNGTDLVIQFGRIGTAGQSQTKSFESGAGASQEFAKLVREKTKKGSVEVASDGTAAPPAAAVTPAPTPKSASKKATKATPEPAPEAPPAVAGVPASTPRRMQSAGLTSFAAAAAR